VVSFEQKGPFCGEIFQKLLALCPVEKRGNIAYPIITSISFKKMGGNSTVIDTIA
jgi:hypothetical protein